MELWRYTAIRSEPDQAEVQKRGELMASTAADVRASLLRIGWQVVKLHRARQPWQMPAVFRGLLQRHLRKRRRSIRAEIYEGLSSLLESGLPLVECLEIMGMDQDRWTGKARRSMLVQWREAMRSGASPAIAMRELDTWFDEVDCAMIDAGQQGGMLPVVLKQMAFREERADQFGNQIIGAMTYPAILLIAAIGVTVFLSVKTLPELANLLTTAHVSVPGLTVGVMTLGQLVARCGLLVAVLAGSLVGLGAILLRLAIARSEYWAQLVAMCTPRVIRISAVARFAQTLADLLRSGVPAIEALGVLSQTASPALACTIRAASQRIEEGEDLAQALTDPCWFSPQFQRLLHSAQSAGDLESTLERLAQRDQRRAERQLKKLATLLEPAAILVLATLVGTVVLAAVLPLTRLQEVIG